MSGSIDGNGYAHATVTMATGTEYDQSVEKHAKSDRNNLGMAYGINLVGNRNRDHLRGTGNSVDERPRAARIVA
jgi:hypothetical protein